MAKIGRFLSLLLNGYTLMGLLGTVGGITFWHDIRHQPLWVQILWLLAALVIVGLAIKHRKVILETFKKGSQPATQTNIANTNGPTAFLMQGVTDSDFTGNLVIFGEAQNVFDETSHLTDDALRTQTLELVNEMYQYFRERPDDAVSDHTQMWAEMNQVDSPEEKKVISDRFRTERSLRQGQERRELNENFGGRVRLVVGEFLSRKRISSEDANLMIWKLGTVYWAGQLAASLEGLALAL